MGSRRDWARANQTHNRQSIVATFLLLLLLAPRQWLFSNVRLRAQRTGRFKTRRAYERASGAPLLSLAAHDRALTFLMAYGRTGVPGLPFPPQDPSQTTNIYSVMRSLVPPTCADHFCFSVPLPWLFGYTYSRPGRGSIAAPRALEKSDETEAEKLPILGAAQHARHRLDSDNRSPNAQSLVPIVRLQCWTVAPCRPTTAAWLARPGKRKPRPLGTLYRLVGQFELSLCRPRVRWLTACRPCPPAARRPARRAEDKINHSMTVMEPRFVASLPHPQGWYRGNGQLIIPKRVQGPITGPEQAR